MTYSIIVGKLMKEIVVANDFQIICISFVTINEMCCTSFKISNRRTILRIDEVKLMV